MDPDHLAIIKQGVTEWNRWRAEYLQRPNLDGVDLGAVKLRGVDLRQTNLSGANFGGALLTGAKLHGANLSGANLSGANLMRANLSKAHLSDANLQGAYLREALLLDTFLFDANLSNANLLNATLTGATLIGANLSGALLQGSDLSGVQVGRAIFADVDLSVAKGLETMRHSGPSTIGIDTIYKSRGKVSDAFLRGAGVPDNLIAYIGSLVGKPIEFYSCFISYSTKDQEFADRLYADLQTKGVRCWFAPKDLKAGDKFRDRIDESIRLHDKLLLVLSEHSIASAWVRREVEAASEREDRQNAAILFPIRIDDAAVQTDQAWAADIRRTRQIGNFNQWTDQHSYEKAFERLLRDLEAEAAESDKRASEIK